MANAAFGFKLASAKTASQPLMRCIHLVGDGVLLGKGDAVKKVTGSISLAGGPIVQAVARAASGDRVMGICVGFEQHTVASGNINLNRTHCPASTAMYVLVRPVTSDDEFEVMEDGVGNSVATTSVGQNITMIVANANTTTGMSGTMADSSTAATTNTLDLKITGFRQSPNNVPGTNAILLVKFNKIENVDQATGV